MGYRPDNQALEPAIDEIISGIEKFHSAHEQRIISGDWSEEHYEELSELELELYGLKRRLQRLKRETW